MDELMEKLQYAKQAVTYLITHSDSLVDFHGLVYWAGEIERLRLEIKNAL